MVFARAWTWLPGPLSTVWARVAEAKAPGVSWRTAAGETLWPAGAAEWNE